MSDQYTERVERLVDWLEGVKKRYRLTQQQMGEMAGISHSYYSKIVASWRFQRAGEGPLKRLVNVPDQEIFEKLLTGLEARFGEQVAEDGWRILREGSCPVGVQHTDEDLIKLVIRIQRLPREKRQAILNLVSHLE